MPICCPDITTPERLAETRARLSKDTHFIYGTKLMVETPAHGTNISGPSWPGGMMYLYLPWRYKHESQIRMGLIASILFQGFTGNCGIRAITCNMLYTPSMGKLWFELFESYAYSLGYSVLVGSTGQQNGTHQLAYVQEHGVNWKIENPGHNRRVGPSDQLFVYWKYLTEPKLQVNWAQDIPNAQQITDS